MFDSFKNRRDRENAGAPVYVYEELPDVLRTRLVLLLRDALTMDFLGPTQLAFDTHRSVTLALARHSLGGGNSPGAQLTYHIESGPWDEAITVVEAVLQHMHWQERERHVDDVNRAFRESAVGYEYREGMFMRVDSPYLHAQGTVPAFTLLHAPRFAAADGEFRKAHAHLRASDNEGAIVEALKAFESVLKVILTDRGISFDPSSTASKLIAACIAARLFSSYMEQQVSAVRLILESGTPTVRNKQGAHGAGIQPRQVPDHLAAFALHSAATCMVFLAAEDASAP